MNPAIIAFLKPVWAFLKVGITIPIWIIIAAGIWWQVDKGSAIKEAVKRATTQLVAGAELEALRAQRAAAEAIADHEKRKADDLAAANAQFAADLSKANQDYANAIEDLEELAAQPAPADCAVDPGLLGRLPNR